MFDKTNRACLCVSTVANPVDIHIAEEGMSAAEDNRPRSVKQSEAAA